MAIVKFLTKTLNSSHHVFLPKSRLVRFALMLFGSFCLIAQQSYHFRHASSYKARFNDAYSTGVMDELREFVPFYNLTGLFPLASVSDMKHGPITAEILENELKNKPENLRTELGHVIRAGETGAIWLLNFDAILKSDPRNTNFKSPNFIFFTLALIALFLSMALAGYAWLGFAISALLGSSPHQISEVYVINNVFGYSVTVFIFLFALNFSYFKNRLFNSRLIYLIPVASGVVLGTMHHIRTEPVAAIVSLIFLYVFADNLRKEMRILSILALLVSFFLVDYGLTLRLNQLYDRTVATVKNVGGVPFEGERADHHPFFPSLIGGLQDFDTKYHINRLDHDVIERIKTIYLKDHSDFEQIGCCKTNTFADSKGLYYQRMQEQQDFINAGTQYFLSLVKSDPLWYFGILWNRVIATFSDQAPVELNIFGFELFRIPYHWSWFFIILVFLIFDRTRLYLKMILFFAPLSFVAILVSFRLGLNYYQIWQNVAVAVSIYLGSLGIFRIAKMITEKKLAETGKKMASTLTIGVDQSS